MYFYNGTNNPYLSGTGAWTDASDEKIKKNIEDIDYGLETINTLKPRKFKKVNPNEYPDEIRKPADESATWSDEQENKVWDGLIAQEVKEVIDKLGTTFSGWNEESNSKQLVAYSSLVTPLIKSVQELTEMVKSQQKEIEELKKQ